MRVSKQNHLKRLLQTQDVLLSTIAYLSATLAVWFLGFADIGITNYHVRLTPFVLVLGVVASSGYIPVLHNQPTYKILLFSLRFAGIIVVGMLAIAYFGKFDNVSRYILVLTGFLITGVLLANRLLLRWWYFRVRRESSDNYLKVLVIGSGNRARRLMRTYKEKSEWGIDFIGILDPDVKRMGHQLDGISILGDIAAVGDVLSAQVVDEVVVCLPRSLINSISEIFRVCAEQGVAIKFMADFYDMPNSSISLEVLDKTPILNFDPVFHEEGKLVIKRIVDLLIAIPGLIVLIPFFVLVALAIKIDTKGPAFFVQERVGLNKRLFQMIKFRSMHENAEQSLADVEHLNEAQGPIFKVSNDPRITRVGKLIRRTSVDELPQLINVVLGQMSLIGPRPMSVRDVERFSLGVQQKRFSIRPGLACLREVSGRSKLSFDQWLALDLQYIDEWSLWLDIKILMKLLPSVIRGEGAS